jgi:phosphotransferase system  glucose/maltose/N-acetylglucosamine-specific IIC component
MLDLLPPVYLVALGLGVAAVFVVLFYSFTSNSNYESQMRRQQLAERRARQVAAETQSSTHD